MPDSYAPDRSYGPSNSGYGPKSISRDLHYAPETHYGPPEKTAKGKAVYILPRSAKTASDQQDQHGNPKRYTLSGALALVSAFWLEGFAGTFVRNFGGGAYWDQVWPILPFRNWKSKLHAFFSNSKYIGHSVELQPIEPAQPPPPPLDTTLPTITAFTMPSTATSKSVAVTSFTATDNDGVIGYQITEEPTPPPSGGLWYTSPLTRFVFANYGTNVAFAWAMDKSGNVSTYEAALVDCVAASPPETWEPLPVPPQRTAPEVGAFTLAPIESSRRRVNVVSFEGSSWLAITGYLITDDQIPPEKNDARWSATKPTTYTFPGDGEQTAYAWVKDASDTVSTYKAFVVTVWAEGVPTYGKLITMPHGFETPYEGLSSWFAFSPNYASPNGRYPSTNWYAQNTWLQLSKSWDHGETEQGTIALTEQGGEWVPDTYRMGTFQYSATPYVVPADEGRMIAFNTASEENIYVGVPDIGYTTYGSEGDIPYPNMSVAPLIPAQGRPTNNGHLYYCDGTSGVYMGGDDVLFTFSFTTWYVPCDIPGPYTYTYKHILGDERHGFYERAGVANTLPANFTLIGTDVGKVDGRYPTSHFTELFTNSKTAVLAALLNRGRKPRVASNIHNPTYNSGFVGYQTNCVIATWVAVCVGKIPNGAHGDITIDGVVSLNLFGFVLDNGLSYDGYPVSYHMGAAAPTPFPIHYPANHPTCEISPYGGYADSYSYLWKYGVETGLGLPFYPREVRLAKYLGGNNVVGTMQGYPVSEGVTNAMTEYLQKGTLMWLYDDETGDPTEYTCPTNPPPSIPSNIDVTTFPQGEKTWTVYSNDRGLTWHRLVAPPGLTEGDLSAAVDRFYPLNGGSLSVFSANKDLWLVSTATGSVSKLDPYGYDSSGAKIRVQDRVTAIVGNTDAGSGELFFYTSTMAGDTPNPQVKYFISASASTIETHGPKITFVNSVTCFGPDQDYLMDSFVVEGFADNIIRVTPPLPHANTIVVVSYDVEQANQKRMLLLSDFGATVYDAGWVEQSWNGEMMLDSFAGGGFDPAFGGDTAYPYTPPIFVPLQIISPPDLGTILGGVEGEFLQIQVTGGRFPYSFGVSEGALPTGMSLDPVGYIGGVATIGTYSFTIQVADNELNMVSQAFTCEVV